MDIAKSLFTSRTHEGYSGKQNYNKNVETALSDEEDDEGERENESKEKESQLKLDVNRNAEKDTLADLSPMSTPSPGGPFSALTPSMWPQDIISKLNQVPEDPNSQPDYRFDEFGFRVEEEDGPEQNSNKLLSEPFIEDPQHRLQWVAYLEFNSSSANSPGKEESEALTWDNLGVISRTDKLRSMTRQGIPHSLRPQLWLRLSGALEKKALSKIKYQDIVKASSSDALAFAKQIEKDLLRTMPTNACFSTFSSTGVPRLRRILRALAWLFPDIGYCQGTGMIAASLLLLMEEEEAFWTLSAIVEDLLPASYYTPNLIGIQADQKVLRSLVASGLPQLELSLLQHDIELSLITLHWFLTLFASVVHFKILLRIWDLLFLDGSMVLFQITLGMLKIKEPVLVTLENSAEIFNALSDIPGDIVDIDNLLEVSFSVSTSISQSLIDSHRRRHLAFLMSDQGALIGNPALSNNLPKQQLNRRKVKRQKSILQNLIFGEEENGEDIKTKNIHQTEILVDLREATCQIGRHFLTTDPRLSHASLTPNYSPESHQSDHDAYADVSRSRQRRAKALLDFERHDDDELGFRKNDVITIISQKDEHCWIGELNGLKGWFPAKFVELLDERSKQYSLAGDDSVTETITDLVRGTLCPALKQILSCGLKRRALGEVCHPWLFIEEVATREVEKDFTSVYSRLLLCKTYRLDEDGKVLTPEELLYRCVQAVNQSHDMAHVQMDVKFRSLICLGLNEQVLHLWLEVLCSCEPVVLKWYHPWSFISSPGWVQVKCDLRVLSQFPFNLSPDWELPPRKGQSQPLKDGVQDMLVKHHLFSWDL